MPRERDLRMDREILTQYADLREEIKDIRRRVERVYKQLERLETGGTVIDAVKGTRQDGTFGSIHIEGFPCVDHEKKRKSLQSYVARLAEAEERLLELTNAVEEYINSIEDSRMRRIVRYRFIDGLSWNEVADMLGENHTEGSVKMAFGRFFEK